MLDFIKRYWVLLAIGAIVLVIAWRRKKSVVDITTKRAQTDVGGGFTQAVVNGIRFDADPYNTNGVAPKGIPVPK